MSNHESILTQDLDLSSLFASGTPWTFTLVDSPGRVKQPGLWYTGLLEFIGVNAKVSQAGYH